VLVNADSSCGTNAKEVVKLEWLSLINRRKGNFNKLMVPNSLPLYYFSFL